MILVSTQLLAQLSPARKLMVLVFSLEDLVVQSSACYNLR